MRLGLCCPHCTDEKSGTSEQWFSGFPVVSLLESGRVRKSPLHRRLGVLEETWLPVAVATGQITSTDGDLRVVEGAIRISKLGEGGGDGCRTMLSTP